MLEVLNVACVRGDRTLFSDVSFTLARGALLHVAGANGSGKTSLLRIVCGLMQPVSGEVRWSGGNIHSLAGDYWSDLAYIGHANALKDDLTAAENLDIAAALRGRATTRETALAALDRLGVAHCAHLPVRVLSQGQRRRVTLARLLMSDAAPLWVLDEPFPGLDTDAVQLIATTLAAHMHAGGCVLLTTHQEVLIDAPVQQRLDLSVAC